MDIFKSIETFSSYHNLFEYNQTIIIGLSGGPDSVFLLHFLLHIQQKYNLTLIAAHLNHEWRSEADAEEELCKILTRQYNIPFVSTKISSLATIIKKKYQGSKEEYARNMRRFFLEKVLHEYSANSIALGHHAQDQQETFFIRLIRGTSLTGLTGIAPKKGFYIRPLLETNKTDIIQWLTNNNISYALDASNESVDYLRNRIRLKVIPALQECDARWNENFLLTLNRLKQDNVFINDIAQKTFNTIVTHSDNNYILNISQFIETTSALHHRIIVLWLIQNNVEFPPTQAFLDEIIRFLYTKQGGIHTIHADWCIVKKQNKAFINKS